MNTRIMWAEARKQERMIRGLIVDYRRRAERRKDFYEKIKADPTQFLQLHGRPCKIHLDPAIAAAGDSPVIMMPWQGNTNNMIDRFDVRAHLDYIPEVRNPDIAPEELDQEERHCNYERYRILAQNSFLDISEDKFLQQLAIEEQFGVTIEEKEAQKEKLNEKKGTGVAIGYNYSDPGAQPSCSIGPETKPKEKVEHKDSDDDSDLDVIDVDLSIDVNKMEAQQAHELNAVGPLFGMAGCDLFSFLTGDADDAEHQKQLLIEEKEKAMFSGRKSRRERRAHRDKKLATRVISPPSYAAPSSELPRQLSRSPSRSPSPEVGEKIQFITSFGGEDEERPPAPLPKPTLYSEKLKKNLKKSELYSDVARKSKARSRSSSGERRSYRPKMGPHRQKSRSRSYSYSRSRSRSPPRRRTRSYSRSRSRSSRSRSRSYSPQRRPRSRHGNYRSRRSRSNENNSSGYVRRYNDRSMSFESHDKDKASQSKPPVPRYYGRKKDEQKSSSELSLESDSSDGDDEAKNNSTGGNKTTSHPNQLRLTGSSNKGTSREAISLKEKLKKKMQAQLSRQLRADKRAEAERLERESRRQARRDEEMRELALKLRRKQREMRHQRNRRSSDDSDRSQSDSSSRGSPRPDKEIDKSPSRSPSPKKIPVWTSNQLESVPDRPRYHDERSRYPEERPRYDDHDERSRYQEERPRYDDRARFQDSERPRYPEHPERPRYQPNDRPKYSESGESSYYQDNYRKRFHESDSSHRDERGFDQQRPRQFDERNREYDSNKDFNRWSRDGNGSGERRPYRGGYRGRGFHHGDGPSNWDSNRDDERKKVKLVDY